MKMSSFDSEFSSASNGDTFFHGKTIGKNFTFIFVLFPIDVYVTIYDVEDGVLFLQNEFPCFKMSPFGPEFDSASNGDTFFHGKTIGKNFTFIFVLSRIHAFVTIYDVEEGVLFLQNEFPCMKMGPFDAEFNSALIGDTFIHGKTMGKWFRCILLCVLYIYVSII
jgi:uncharacterized membrane protein YsdA (DUF1294 family)